ncbi:MAG: hypothetical protein Kow0080_32880 [Candidatus Promineifilaceae bacterium]
MFEDLFPGNLLSGQAVAAVRDPNGINPPNNIIQTDDTCFIDVRWHIVGAAAGFLGGEWKVTVYYESIGGGPEGQFPSQTVPLSAAPATQHRDYSTTITVPAGTLPPGAYRLVTLINYSNLGVPQEMAAFVEGPIMQVYDPS